LRAIHLPLNVSVAVGMQLLILQLPGTAVAVSNRAFTSRINHAPSQEPRITRISQMFDLIRVIREIRGSPLGWFGAR